MLPVLLLQGQAARRQRQEGLALGETTILFGEFGALGDERLFELPGIEAGRAQRQRA